MLGKGVEVKERIFENNRKNVIKLKNRKMSRIMVEIGVLTINDFIQTWGRKREKEICCEKHNYPVKTIQNWTVVDKEDIEYGLIPFS